MTKGRLFEKSFLRASKAEKLPDVVGFERDPETGTDRFGNRLFHTQDRKLYSSFPLGERVQLHQAALLISPVGNEILTHSPGTLQGLDATLQHAIQFVQDKTFEPGSIVSGPTGMELEFLARKGQAATFKSRIADRDCIVKLQGSLEPHVKDPAQPFLHEMLQTQAVQTDIGEQLRAMGVRLPEWYFASGLVGCKEFVAGNQPSNQVIKDLHKALLHLMRTYIKEQVTAGNALWDNIATDLQVPSYTMIINDQLGASSQRFRFDNFIEEADGNLVWIDPFRVGTEYL